MLVLGVAIVGYGSRLSAPPDVAGSINVVVILKSLVDPLPFGVTIAISVVALPVPPVWPIFHDKVPVVAKVLVLVFAIVGARFAFINIAPITQIAPLLPTGVKAEAR